MCVCVIQAEAQMLCNNCNHPHRKTHSTLPFAAPALSCLSTSSGSSMFSLFSSAWQSPQDLQRVPHTTHQTHNIWSVLQKNGYSRTGNKASARCARASPRASCGGDRSREIRKDASLQKKFAQQRRACPRLLQAAAPRRGPPTTLREGVAVGVETALSRALYL